jgi:cell division protease FtsH
MMETLTDRVTRYLLARIRRLAILDLNERATIAGLLEQTFVVPADDTTGTVWHVPDRSLRLLDADPAKAHAAISLRLRRAPLPLTELDVLAQDFSANKQSRIARSGFGDSPVPGSDGNAAQGGYVNTLAPFADRRETDAAFRTLLRAQLPPPHPAHVAIALLVARAIGSSVPDLRTLLDVIGKPGAFVMIKAPVARFERRIGLMLEDALILPYWAKLEDVHRSSPLSDGYGDRRHGKIRRTIKTIAGTDVPRAIERSLTRFLADALLERAVPVVIADETTTALPPIVSMTPDLILECDGLDHLLIAELLHHCCGIAPKQSLRAMETMALDLEGISIDALALTVRPGRSLEHILTTLQALGARARAAGTSDADDQKNEQSGKLKVKSTPATNDGNETAATDSLDIVQPECASGRSDAGTGEPPRDPIDAISKQRRPLTIEALAGYGEAREWAFDLKADLQLWREGGLAWSELSTKLLLSGSPGTGKTIYARALCNTLQLPLLVTSVASWLEPGFLGDVLKAMSTAFDVARRHSPAILFIDEIDNIGSRSGVRRADNDDYWRSLINRLLELVDGVLKSEGVIIVAATNLPDRIDPALMRSGRLERHIAIPLPDAETLASILAHHLAGDVSDVLRSAPTTARTPAATGSTNRPHDKSDAASISDDIKREGPHHG